MKPSEQGHSFCVQPLCGFLLAIGDKKTAQKNRGQSQCRQQHKAQENDLQQYNSRQLGF
jgi:hypothetical protein